MRKTSPEANLPLIPLKSHVFLDSDEPLIIFLLHAENNAERSEAWITADVAVTPTVVPIMELKYELEVAIALSASLIPVVNDMKATDRTSPFPKPL